jgi:hypothetical protein
MSTDDDRSTSPQDRDETPAERADRNLDELLQELRVALPGVQVLFAFLFSVPFAQRFSEVSDFGEDVYFVTLLSGAVASALLIAPSAYHRLNFSQGDKQHIVRVANIFAIVGFVVLALAMTGAVLLVTTFVFDGGTAGIGTAVVGGALLMLWFVLPLARRIQRARME